MEEQKEQPTPQEKAKKLLILDPQKVQEAIQNVNQYISDTEFAPIVWPNQETANSNIWQTSTLLAWNLRLADHSQNLEVKKQILDLVDNKPRFGTYILYQLLSDSYETEGEVNGLLSQELTTLSDDLREKATLSIVTLSEKIANEEYGEPEKEILDAIVERSLVNVELLGDITTLDENTPLGDSYLTLKDWREIKEKTSKLRQDNPVIAALFTKLKALK
jgi:hypothetical protein